ncbi:galactose metabolism-related protein [Marasmius crinis-equi]|uniref:Galactose metabolism-related protein n=1 Tax=Marasmius crinis-equi TaxID=585013 RepID=A0ABR3FTJ6_9AGAR
MGNSQSQSPNLSATNSPQYHTHALHGSRSGTASPVPGQSKSSRPLRKRSIDLPDLAALSPAMAMTESLYGERSFSGMKSAPLPIPACDDRGGGRKINQADYAIQPSAHIDQFRKSRSGTSTRSGGSGAGANGQPTAPARGRPPKGNSATEPSSRVPSRGRGSQYMHYIPSNLSITTFQRPAPPPPSRNHSFVPQPAISDPLPDELASSRDGSVDSEDQEILVTSSIPLGIYSRLDPFAEIAATEGLSIGEGDVRVHVQELDVIHGEPDEVLVKISWHGEGQTVFLALESDNTWNGRKQMELETSPPFPIPFNVSPTVSPPTSAPTSAPTSPPCEVSPVTSTTVFSTTVSLKTDKTTHHLRFLVDNEWRIADNLPTAVDSTGALANYLVVGLVPTVTDANASGTPAPKSRHGLLTRTVSLPASAAGTTVATPNGQSAQTLLGSLPLPNGSHISHANRHVGIAPTGNTHVHPAASSLGRVRQYKQGLGLGYSFWSASSSNDYEAIDVEVEPTKERNTGSSSDGRRRRSPPPPVKMPIAKVHYEPQWTTEIPLELIEAAQEEEVFLEHQAQVRNQMQSKSRAQQNRPQHVSGFIPLPNIPPATNLPRYLEKLILNSTGQHGRNSGGGSSASGEKDRDGRRKDREREREKERRAVPSPISSNNSSAAPLPVTTASGTDVTTAHSHSTHRTYSHHHHHYHHKHHPHRSSSDREVATPNHPPITAVTAVAISSNPSGPSQRLTTNDENAAIVADDSSVLPVPSHVVLQHLSTSAIKNGVLAVSQTGRYHNKFATTVYYKPT